MNTSPAAENGRYPAVRALDRGLRLIEALAEFGWSTPQSLSKNTGIDRGTVYRLLATLVRTGYVERRAEDGQYVLSAKIREVASGVRDDDRVVGIISPLLAELVSKVFWPSDFAMPIGGRLRIVASSHHLTSMTFFRRLVGKERPFVESALGRAILSAMSDEERQHALLALDDAADPERVDRLVRETRAAGYASAIGTSFDNISAIALPVRGAKQVVGAVNLVFFRSAMSPVQAAERYLPALKLMVEEAERKLILEWDER